MNSLASSQPPNDLLSTYQAFQKSMNQVPSETEKGLSLEQSVTLPNGRRIAAIQSAEAQLIWRSMVKAGLYSKAAKQLRSDDVVLDIGAHIGLAAMYFFDAAPGVKIISAEAAPRTHACLAHNLAAHVPGAVAIKAAVAGTRGERQFTFYENSPANSGLFANVEMDDANTRVFLHNTGIDDEDADELIQGLHKPTSLTVQTLTVSDLIRQFGVQQIGLLKIDVERAELEVAQGIEEQHWPLIRYVSAEVHASEGRLDSLKHLLEMRGFSVSVSQDASLRDTDLFDLDAVRI